MLADLVGGETRAERETIPADIAGHPFGDLEVGHPRLPVQPDGRDLRDRQAHSLGLGGQLDADLEPVPRIDANLPDEFRRVGLERVRRVPGADVGQDAQRPAGQPGHGALDNRAADLLTARHVAGRRRHRYPALHQPDELVDLPGVVAPVRHGHHGHRGGRGVDAEPDRVRGPATVGVDQAFQPRFLLRVLLGHRHGRVVGRIDDHQHLARQPDRLEQPVKHAEDLLALVVRGHHHRDAGTLGHIWTPCPRMSQMSAAGLPVTSPRYSGCGAPTTSRSDRVITSSRGSRPGSTVT